MSKNFGSGINRFLVGGMWRLGLKQHDWPSIGPSTKLLCLSQAQTTIQHMHGNIPYKLDYWADKVGHLLLTKSSMDRCLICYFLLPKSYPFLLMWPGLAKKIAILAEF